NYSSNGSALDFHAVNTGWGGATCDLSVTNSWLERLYAKSALSFQGTVYTGDRMLLRVAHVGANLIQLSEVRKEISEREQALSALKIALDRRDANTLKQFRAPLFSSPEVNQLAQIIEHIQKREKIQPFEKEYFTKSYLPQNAIPTDPITVVGTCL